MSGAARHSNKQNNKMTTHTYTTLVDALKAITSLNSGTYYLAYGEYARPDYTARKIRNGARYYIHAKRYFYAGTINAPKSGALTIRDLHSL